MSDDDSSFLDYLFATWWGQLLIALMFFGFAAGL